MLTEQQKMEALIDISMELHQVKDIDILMENILTLARNFAAADAGSIYLKEGNRLKFSYTQNETLQQRLHPGEKLIYNTFEIPIDRTSIAGYVASSGEQLHIADTENIDPALPFKFNRAFDKASGYWTQSLLTTPLKTSRGDIVGILQIINCRTAEGRKIPFPPDTERFMAVFAGMAAIALERAKMMREMILRTIRMAEMRDPKETGAHVNRVAGYAIEIYESWAKKNGVADTDINQNRDILRMAAMLHDIGKVAIADAILKKPGKLTAEEYEIMKRHTILGASLFSDKSSDFDDAAAEVALNHHNRWDGKGYPGHVDPENGTPLPGHRGPDGHPLGKSGREIPLYGRITAIADIFDALSSRRSYKEPWTEEQCLKEIEENRGTIFDPELLDHFFQCLPSIRQIQQRYREEDSP